MLNVTTIADISMLERKNLFIAASTRMTIPNAVMMAVVFGSEAFSGMVLT